MIHKILVDVPGWEMEALGLTNPKKASRLDRWFRFLAEESPAIDGDVAEFGVFRGASLVPSALILREVAPDKKLWGLDSFSGFPELVDPNDQMSRFDQMAQDGIISKKHLRQVHEARMLRINVGDHGETFDAVSSSKDFSATSRSLVEFRAAHYKLTNIRILEGYFEDTVSKIGTSRLCGILLDSDLYAGYQLVLGSLGEILSPGGMVFLDEYFSLKFPGPRIAVDEFLAKNPGKFKLQSQWEDSTGFERNWLTKQ